MCIRDSLLGGEIPTVAVVLVRDLGGLVDGAQLVQPLLVAEAVVGAAELHQFFGVVDVDLPPLALDIGPDRAADVRPLVVHKAGLGERLIDDVGRALDQPLLVGVLNACLLYTSRCV